MRTPIVLCLFNRPDTTARVFSEIAKVKPQQLYVVADGPRPDRPDDVADCAKTRSIIDRIDWDYQVHRNFSDSNLGCTQRMATRIGWAFTHVEEAIILEDDCLPDPTFFQFCAELLERYLFPTWSSMEKRACWHDRMMHARSNTPSSSC